MLALVPRTWYSWDFTVVDDGRELAFMDLSGWREKGTLTSDRLRVFVIWLTVIMWKRDADAAAA